MFLWYPSACLPIASPNLLSLRHFDFCVLQVQVLSFQGIAHSFLQRPSHKPFIINYLRTLFIATEGVPPLLLLSFLFSPTPFLATLPKHRPLTPIIATLPNLVFLPPVFATHPSPPGGVLFLISPAPVLPNPGLAL